MKKFLIILLVVLILLFAFFSLTNDNQKVVDNMSDDNSSEVVDNTPEGILNNLDITITGYGPGKSHTGTFNNYRVDNIEVSDGGIPTSAMVVIDVISREFDSKTLDDHLCNENFFNCDTFPEIVFETTDVINVFENDFSVTGNLTFKGVTKEVSFPVTKENDVFKVSTKVNVAEYGFTSPGVEDEVLIEIRTK